MVTRAASKHSLGDSSNRAPHYNHQRCSARCCCRTVPFRETRLTHRPPARRRRVLPLTGSVTASRTSTTSPGSIAPISLIGLAVETVSTMHERQHVQRVNQIKASCVRICTVTTHAENRKWSGFNTRSAVVRALDMHVSLAPLPFEAAIYLSVASALLACVATSSRLPRPPPPAPLLPSLAPPLEALSCPSVDAAAAASKT